MTKKYIQLLIILCFSLLNIGCQHYSYGSKYLFYRYSMIKSIMLFLMILNLTSCNIPLRNLEASPVDNIENLRNINLAFRMERSPYIETSIGKGQIYFFRASEASIYAPNDKTSLLLNHINETLLESATSWVTDFVDPRNFSMPILIYQSSRKNSKGSSLQI